MRPLTVITGIAFGSCFSIAVSLLAVLLVFLILGDDYPRLGHEFRGLIASLAIFTGMTAISGLSFYWMLKAHRWRHLAHVAMWGGIAATSYYYWP